MNISNVVLDRDRNKVIFNNDQGERLEKAVYYKSDCFGWKCTVNGRYCKAIEDHLLSEPHHAQYDVTLAESKPEQVKQKRYTDDDGRDLIDKWAETYQHDQFRLIMWAMMEKYNTRLGRKDSTISEVSKMADYMNRWLEYETQWHKE